MSILKTHQLTKQYPGDRGAFDINLDLNKGEIVGFIGPNGAGKSTTLNMLGGFLIPDRGEISAFGTEVDWRTIYTMSDRIGILASEVAYDPSLTPRQIFQDTQALLNQDLQDHWQSLAKELELNLEISFHKLSLGNRKKVGVINAVMHSPDLLLLDEPTSGLDPLIQQKCLSLFQKTAQKGGAVLLSSHVLGEVQEYCDRIVMIKDGRIILEDTTVNILEQAQKLFRIKNLPQPVLSAIKKLKIHTRIEEAGAEVLIYTPRHQPILDILHENNVYDFYLERPGLEYTFMDLYQ